MDSEANTSKAIGSEINTTEEQMAIINEILEQFGLDELKAWANELNLDSSSDDKVVLLISIMDELVDDFLNRIPSSESVSSVNQEKTGEVNPNFYSNPLHIRFGGLSFQIPFAKYQGLANTNNGSDKGGNPDEDNDEEDEPFKFSGPSFAGLQYEDYCDKLEAKKKKKLEEKQKKKLEAEHKNNGNKPKESNESHEKLTFSFSYCFTFNLGFFEYLMALITPKSNDKGLKFKSFESVADDNDDTIAPIGPFISSMSNDEDVKSETTEAVPKNTITAINAPKPVVAGIVETPQFSFSSGIRQVPVVQIDPSLSFPSQFRSCTGSSQSAGAQQSERKRKAENENCDTPKKASKWQR